MPEEKENATLTAYFGFVFEKNSGREITLLSWSHRIEKLRFQDVFPPHENEKSVFKKLCFRDGSSNRKKTAALSNFSTVMCPLSK